MGDSFDTVLRAYHEGAGALRAAATAALAKDDTRVAGVERLLEISQELEHIAAQDLDAGDGDVREAAALKLVAGAALDLAQATDLLRATPDGAALAVEEGKEWERTYARLQPVLDSPSALGARAAVAVTSQPNESALERPPGHPPTTLQTAAEQAIAGIAQNAGEIADKAIDGLMGVPLDALTSAFGASADKLIGLARAQVARGVRIALRFVAKAASKLLRLLGPLEPVARKWLLEKLGGLAQKKLVDFAVGRALEVERVRDDVDAMIAEHGARADPAHMRACAEELHALDARFGRHKLVASALATVLGKVQRLLIDLAGWAAAAVAGIFVLMLSYGVWVGGDFLDWYRTRQDGRLDLVAGVRSIVELALGGGAAEAAA
jgi:hypothetical protein